MKGWYAIAACFVGGAAAYVLTRPRTHLPALAPQGVTQVYWNPTTSLTSGTSYTFSLTTSLTPAQVTTALQAAGAAASNVQTGGSGTVLGLFVWNGTTGASPPALTGATWNFIEPTVGGA